MGKKKAKFKPPKIEQGEMEELREHGRVINEKSKDISEKYKKWWDTDKKKWKDGFKGHGHS